MNLTQQIKQKRNKFSRWRKQAVKIVEQFTLFLSFVALLLLIYNIGFTYSPATERAIHKANSYLLVIFFVVLGLRFLALFNRKNITRKSWLEIFLLLFFFLALCLRFFMRDTAYSENQWIG